MMPDNQITPIQDADRPWLRQFFTERWGASLVVSRGQVHHSDDLPGFIVRSAQNTPLGAATYRISQAGTAPLLGPECELVTLDSLVEGKGVGAALIAAVRQVALDEGCQRLWLITTNDNLHALRFYQRHGFRLAAVHAGAVAQSRRIKPSIPEIGLDGIPLRDELELEMPLVSRISPYPPELAELAELVNPTPPTPERGGDWPSPGVGGVGKANSANSSKGGPRGDSPAPLLKGGLRGDSSAGTRLSRRPVYESKWVNLYLDHVRFPSGREIVDFHLVDYPTEAVAAYITNDQGEVLMGNYYRYPLGKLCWEVPAGGIDPGEDVCAAAQREVMEETGYTTHDYTKFYTFYPTSGSTNKVFHLVRGFAGERLSSHDPDELVDVAWFSLPQLRQLIRQGVIDDGYTLVALLVAWELGL